jgi:hypothetical protein
MFSRINSIENKNRYKSANNFVKEKKNYYHVNIKKIKE